MRRREFIALMTAVAAPAACSALAAHAQQVPVIGFLNTQSPESFAPYVEAYRQGLGELGYIEGRNVAIEYRWARGQNDRLAPMAAELVERRVSVLVTTGGDVAALAGKNATSTIPQVFLLGGDPVRLGLVAGLQSARRQRHRRHAFGDDTRYQAAWPVARAAAERHQDRIAYQSQFP